MLDIHLEGSGLICVENSILYEGNNYETEIWRIL